MQDEGICFELDLHLLNYGKKISSYPVHLVDVGEPRNPISIRLMPDRFRLRLNPADCAENSDGAVQHSKRSLHFGSEIDVAGRVDYVDLVLPPVTGCGRGGDGDAPLLFLHHPVHSGFAPVDFAYPVALPCIVENTLGCGGFACIDVGHDSDISNFIQFRHKPFSRRILSQRSPHHKTMIGPAPQVVIWGNVRPVYRRLLCVVA